jgi:hypothetical protein
MNSVARDTPTPSRSIHTLLPLLLVGCPLFGYVAVRAVLLPITWDEAYNYLEFTRQGILLPVRFPMMAANNHFLNTWLTYLTTGILGVSELTLRVPTLAAYGAFLYYTARLSSELSSPLMVAAGFLVLNLNPYLTDFFSLSRGYGIGYGLLAASLWYLYRFLQTGLELRYSRISLALAAFAVAAHLTLIHVLVSLAVVIVMASALNLSAGTAFLPRIRHAVRLHALELAGVGLVCLPVAFVLRAFQRAHSLFYGGTTSFWHDTIVGVFQRSLYEKTYGVMLGPLVGVPFGLSSLLAGLAVLLVAFAVPVSIRCIRRRRQPKDLYLPALVFLLCSCALATLVQHHILKVPYLTGRTALYLLLLGTLLAVVLADTVTRKGGVVRYGLPLAAVFLVIHFLNCLNLAYALEWKVEADVKHMIADVAAAKDVTPSTGRPTVLGINLEFEAPINFYRLVDGLTWLNVADRRMKSHPLSDYYLYTEGDWQAVNSDAFTVLKTYPLTGTLMLRRRSHPSGYETRFDRTVDFEEPADSGTFLRVTSSEVAYRGLRSGLTDARHRRSGGIEYRPDLARDVPARSLIAVSAMVWMESLRNATARLVVEFSRDRHALAWQGVTVQDEAVRAKHWIPVHLSAFVPPDLRPGDRLSIYLTNKGSRVYIDDLRMSWLVASGYSTSEFTDSD